MHVLNVAKAATRVYTATRATRTTSITSELAILLLDFLSPGLFNITMAQKSHTDKAKPARPLLGRKFVPMSGAVKRRAFPQRIGESELVEGPASNSMARQ